MNDDFDLWAAELRETYVEPSGEPVATYSRSYDELQALVDAALGLVFDDLQHDEDGDIPVVAGSSMVFVRVLQDRPAVEIFAEIVVEPVHADRVAVEVELLNRNHPYAKFYVMGQTIRMSFQLIAWPFAPEQLRSVLSRMCTEVDDIARTLVQRVGGRRFLESEPNASER